MKHPIKRLKSVLSVAKAEGAEILNSFTNKASESPTEALTTDISPTLKIKMPNAQEYVELGSSQIKRVYEDKIGPRLLVIIDESAELLNPSGVKNKEGKEEDALKQEMAMIIQSLTQLGRSAGIHVVVCTQRATVADIGGGNVKNNSLATSTNVIVK